MSAQKDAVAAYFDGFRAGDHTKILALLTDDVVWDLPGHAHREGKHEFDAEISNPDFTGTPTLVVDRMIEEGDTVVAIGSGSATQNTGETHRFVYCDVFTFAGDKIARVESYLVGVAG